MVNDAIKTWLVGKAADRASSSLLEAGLHFLVGLPVVFGTFWLILTFLYEERVSSRLALTLSLAAVIVLFVLSAGTDRGQIENRSTLRQGGAEHERRAHWLTRAVKRAAMQNPLAPEYGRAFIGAIASVVLFGPEMVVSAFRLAVKGSRLLRVDIEGCASVMAVLLTRGGPVALADLASVLPGLRLRRALRQLSAIEGIIHIEPAPGLSLSPSFMAELRGLTAAG